MFSSLSSRFPPFIVCTNRPFHSLSRETSLRQVKATHWWFLSELITRGHLILHTALFHSSCYLSCIINSQVSWNHCYNHNDVPMAWVKTGSTQRVSRWLITGSRVCALLHLMNISLPTELHAITNQCQAVLDFFWMCGAQDELRRSENNMLLLMNFLIAHPVDTHVFSCMFIFRCSANSVTQSLVMNSAVKSYKTFQHYEQWYVAETPMVIDVININTEYFCRK